MRRHLRGVDIREAVKAPGGRVTEVERLLALAASEGLITPLGPNVFDEFGKKALFGRCFMFMDALRPVVARIVRRAV